MKITFNSKARSYEESLLNAIKESLEVKSAEKQKCSTGEDDLLDEGAKDALLNLRISNYFKEVGSAWERVR